MRHSPSSARAARPSSRLTRSFEPSSRMCLRPRPGPSTIWAPRSTSFAPSPPSGRSASRSSSAPRARKASCSTGSSRKASRGPRTIRGRPSDRSTTPSMSGALLGTLLRQVSRSFYLSLAILPTALREPIGLAYLLARAADTIPDTKLVARKDRLTHLETVRRACGGEPADVAGVARACAPHQTHAAERRLLERLPQALARAEGLAPGARPGGRGGGGP